MDLGYLIYTLLLVLLLRIARGEKFVIPSNEPKNKLEWQEQAKKTIDKLKERTTNLNRARNVIFFLGDGMGIPTLTTTRIVKAQQRGSSGPEEVLAWDKFPNSALIKTYNTDKVVPDSAGTATAYLTGAKTRKGVIGYDERVIRGDCSSQRKEYETESILTLGSRDGHSVGVVTTARITHASPAGTFAHLADRDWEGGAPTGCHDAAFQLVHGNHSIDVFLGGGLRNFIGNATELPGYPSTTGGRTDGINLVDAWKVKQKEKNKKAKVVLNKDEMDKMEVKNTDSVLGLFAPSHMTWDMTRNKKKEPSLTEMTSKAIELLQEKSRSKEKGFLLFVEGGRIDHGHHEGRAKKALTECVAMEKALVEALKMTSEEDTLILVTADHSHTFAFGGYPDRSANIFNVIEKVADDSANYTALLYANGPGRRVRVNATINNEETNDFEYRQDAGVPLKDETHGGEDVALLANGPHAHLFTGVIEQSTIPHIIAYAACVTDFGSKDLLFNASHCANSIPKPDGFSMTSLAVIIPAIIIVVFAITGSIFITTKYTQRKNRRIKMMEEIPLDQSQATLT